MRTARHTLYSIALYGACFVIGGCSWNPPHRDVPSPKPVSQPQSRAVSAKQGVSRADTRQASRVGVRIAALAEQMVGVPYVYGGRSPRGFDCSGLVYYAHQQIGLSVPRTAAAQQRSSRPVRLDDAQPGDLLFFRETRKVSHVAIYVGGNRFIHEPSSGRRVSYASLEQEYYRRHFSGAGRLH